MQPVFNPAIIFTIALTVLGLSVFMVCLGYKVGRGNPCPQSGIETGTLMQVLSVAYKGNGQVYVLARPFMIDHGPDDDYSLFLLDEPIPTDAKCFMIEVGANGWKVVRVMSLPQELGK